ncbi:MAG: hypothetical protein GXX78_00420, partial [Bacteroidales bacterium]|nr:hypothetical protein [Bacteroidales bacterium]
QYRYSTDNGNNWSAWSTSVPNFAAVVGTNIIQSRRTADGTGCSTSASNQVSWNVVPQPTAPTINTKTPNLTSVCQGNGVSATFNAGSGGVGCSDDYILIIDGGVPVAYTPSSTVGTTATSSIVIQGRRANCTSGAGCTSTAYSTLVSWNINSPTVTISTDYAEDCPELDPAQGFNPQSGNYDAGSTKLVFEVSLSGTTSAIWSFNYAIGGTGVSVRTSGVPSPNYPQSDSVSNTTSNPVVLTFYINNNPPVELYPSLTISNITDANGCSATNVSSSVTIKAMPDVGDYE